MKKWHQKQLKGWQIMLFLPVCLILGQWFPFIGMAGLFILPVLAVMAWLEGRKQKKVVFKSKS